MEAYELLGTIGEGTYGVVLKARHKDTGQLVAVKKFKESDDDEQVRKTALREVRLLKQLQHPNVVNLLEVFRRKRRLFLIFEYVQYSILDVIENRAEKMTKERLLQITWQIVRGLNYLHSNQVMHRDLKPENLLLSSQGVVKLCDFGFARTTGAPGTRYTEYVSTRWYRSPELLVGDAVYSKMVDVWALGCIVAELATGTPLFPGTGDADQLCQIINTLGPPSVRLVEQASRNPIFRNTPLPTNPPLQHNTLQARLYNLDPVLLDFIAQCLKYEPLQRISTSAMLKHPLFADFSPPLEDWFAGVLAAEEKAKTTNANKASGGLVLSKPINVSAPASDPVPPTANPSSNAPGTLSQGVSDATPVARSQDPADVPGSHAHSHAVEESSLSQQPHTNKTALAPGPAEEFEYEGKRSTSNASPHYYGLGGGAGASLSLVEGKEKDVSSVFSGIDDSLHPHANSHTPDPASKQGSPAESPDRSLATDRFPLGTATATAATAATTTANTTASHPGQHRSTHAPTGTTPTTGSPLDPSADAPGTAASAADSARHRWKPGGAGAHPVPHPNPTAVPGASFPHARVHAGAARYPAAGGYAAPGVDAHPSVRYGENAPTGHAPERFASYPYGGGNPGSGTSGMGSMGSMGSLQLLKQPPYTTRDALHLLDSSPDALDKFRASAHHTPQHAGPGGHTPSSYPSNPTDLYATPGTGYPSHLSAHANAHSGGYNHSPSVHPSDRRGAVISTIRPNVASMHPEPTTRSLSTGASVLGGGAIGGPVLDKKRSVSQSNTGPLGQKGPRSVLGLTASQAIVAPVYGRQSQQPSSILRTVAQIGLPLDLEPPNAAAGSGGAYGNSMYYRRQSFLNRDGPATSYPERSEKEKLPLQSRGATLLSSHNFSTHAAGNTAQQPLKPLPGNQAFHLAPVSTPLYNTTPNYSSSTSRKSSHDPAASVHAHHAPGQGGAAGGPGGNLSWNTGGAAAGGRGNAGSRTYWRGSTLGRM